MQEYIDQLIRVYNTLLGVNTKGEDTIIMAHCLTAMREVLIAMQPQSANVESAQN